MRSPSHYEAISVSSRYIQKVTARFSHKIKTQRQGIAAAAQDQ